MTAQPTATGTLGATPLANLLIYALDRRLSGTLVFECGAERSAVSLVEGAPVKIKIENPGSYLGAVLVELGLIDETARDITFKRAAAERRPIGAVLMEEELVTVDQLRAALGEQLSRKLLVLSELPDESLYGYYDGADYLAQYGGPEAATTDPFAAIWRVIKHRGGGAAEAAALAHLGDLPLRPHPLARLNRFGFDRREQAVVDVLRAKPHTVKQLFSTGLLPAVELSRLVYALAACRQVDLGAATLPVGAPASGQTAAVDDRKRSDPAVRSLRAPEIRSSPRASAAPTGVSGEFSAAGASSRVPPTISSTPPPEVDAFRAEILQRLAIIGSKTYYEILGVANDVPAGAISAAFFKLAKRWHPDRLPQELSDVRAEAERVFSRMTEAHQMLTNDEQRREYDRLLHEGGATADEQEKVQQVLRAAAAFQRAEVLVKRGGNPAEAEKHAKIAQEEDPEQAEYVALYLDIISQKPLADFSAILSKVDAAKALQPDNLKVRLYRARILKRSGDIKNAVREFEWVANRDVHNVEAAREVRLYKMRRNSSKPPFSQRGGPASQRGPGGKPTPDKGLLGKWFKK